MHRFQNRKADQGCEEDCKHLCQIGCQKELDRLTDICVNTAALFYCRYDGCKVIVCQYHIRYVLCNVRTCDTHSHADISALDGRSIIYTVARHRCNTALSLPCIDDTYLMLRLYAGINGVFLNICLKLFITDLV